ncbi:hypothetical protein FXO37_03471 [Capsicum annuum]|nr:hypothetical protein FXO37_03471 [Capsicum annuum]
MGLELNTNGSFIKVIGKAGVGGIVRKRNGQMIRVFVAPIQFCTNNYFEGRAALIVISGCSLQLLHSILEMDSLVLVNMILGSIILPESFKEICKKSNKYNGSGKEHPSARPGYVKLNCDGCSKDNTGPCGGRGIIGDDKGHFVNLYNVTTRYKTNNMAETVALSIGIEWCIQQGSRKLKLNVTPN